jgi:Cu/Ag efflux protein CusF
VAALVALFAAAGCGERPRHYHARGVGDVQPELGQVLIAHGRSRVDAAMTMNFDVPDRALLGSLERGQAIDFEVGHWQGVSHAGGARERRFTGGGARLIAPSTIPPPFRLTDQTATRARSKMARPRVLLDFIHAAGPCPILTGCVKVQRAVADLAAQPSRFRSTRCGTPAVLREYAHKRGADSRTVVLTGNRRRGQVLKLRRRPRAHARRPDRAHRRPS